MTLAAMISGGSILNILGCNPVPALINGVTSVNPCGVILACDPREFSFITSGYEGPGVDPSLDIFCTYPPFCTQDVDPIYGGIFGLP
jgi:hypothetical protein